MAGSHFNQKNPSGNVANNSSSDRKFSDGPADAPDWSVVFVNSGVSANFTTDESALDAEVLLAAVEFTFDFETTGAGVSAGLVRRIEVLDSAAIGSDELDAGWESIRGSFFVSGCLAVSAV